MERLKHILRWLGWYLGTWLALTLAAAILSPIVGALLIPFHIIMIPAWFVIPGIVASKKTKKKKSPEELRSEMNAASAKAAEERKQASPPPQPKPQPQAQSKAQTPSTGQGGFGQTKELSEEEMQKIFNEFFGAAKQPQGQPAQTSATPPPRPQTPPPPPKAPEPQQAPPPPPKSPEPPKIDINQATLQDLESIPAVNQILARKILKIREQEGCFSSLQQLFDKAALPDMVQKELSRRCKVETAQGGQEGRIIDF